MSSTTQPKRDGPDFYPTPQTAFKPLLPFLPTGVLIWEPACGDRRLINLMIEAGLRSSGADLMISNYDYLKDQEYYSCIVTNPPYSRALDFVIHACAHADEVFMLLPLNFLASQKRGEWFKAHEPCALFVLCKRPSFCYNRTDSTDYAWFHWAKKPRHKGIFHL